MEHEFWHTRWRENRIGFHESDVHAMLQTHWQTLAVPAAAPVLVPLCGKSLDMPWLREHGHTVIGSELSAIAVRDFFAEQGVQASPTPVGEQTLWRAPGYRLWCGDFFDLGRDEIGAVAAVYDRAALIALPPQMREAYATHLLDLVPPRTQILLLTLQYPDGLFAGPPFSVTHEEIERLFGARCEIEHLEQGAATVKGRFDVAQTATKIVTASR